MVNVHLSFWATNTPKMDQEFLLHETAAQKHKSLEVWSISIDIIYHNIANTQNYHLNRLRFVSFVFY